MSTEKSLIIFGKASQKSWQIHITENDSLDDSLWFFLESKGRPMASSCLGMGLCKLCRFNDSSRLACQTTLKEVLEEENGQIRVDYW